MPYSPEHKQQSRNKILDSAFLLFASKGFDAVSIDDIMENCALTRGTFYAHFSSKGELYSEAIRYGASKSRLIDFIASNDSQKSLSMLFDQYLSLEHVSGKQPCPMAFLATDAAIQNDSAKAAYTDTLKNMISILKSLLEDKKIAEHKITGIIGMMIGTVAVSRSLTDTKLIEDLLRGARENINQILAH